MYNSQLALIDRLKNAVDESGTSIFAATAVDAFAGQIDANGVKQNVKLPGALVMFRDGSPVQNRAGNNFDIMVITESQSFIKKTHLNNNLQKASDVMWFLEQRPGFTYSGDNYLIDTEAKKIKSRLLTQNNRHTVIIISVLIKKLY